MNAHGGLRVVPLFLAPMAGVTNTVFRRICRARGADVLTSEFVSAEGVLHRNERTRRYVEFHPAERPFGIQLFGADPDRLAAAASELAAWVAPDFIDLNFGCPVNKVVAKNGGSSLLRDCPLLGRVAAAVVEACRPLPVSAKIRIGWDRSSVNAVDVARRLEDAGVARVAVHGRTRAQGYGGEADWETIDAVARTVGIPTIGNGDIRSGACAARRVRETAVAGLMIGRAAMSNPWIFEEVRATLEGRPYSGPTVQDRWSLAVAHCRAEIAWRGDESAAMRSMRGRFMTYTHGMPGGARLRERLGRVSRLRDLEEIAALDQGERPALSAAIPTAIFSASR